MEEKNYTLTEKELINELTCALALGRRNALEGIVQGAKKLNMPSLKDLELLLSGYELAVESCKERSNFTTEEIYKKVEVALDRSTKFGMLVSAMEALVE